MKKYLILLFLIAIGTSVYARKSYVNVYANDLGDETCQYMTITGDLPIGFKVYYGFSDKVTIGQLLNMLSQEGYEVEFMSSVGTGATGTRVNYLLSKNISSNEDDAITIVHNDDGEAYEVARYNLQGMQVNENTKGIQIIVYSNYTTKTVIVE